MASLSTTLATGSSEPTSLAGSRRYYIDWLRVFAIFLVFVYHSIRPFGSDDYHIMNSRSYPFVDAITSVLPVLGMPLVFLISGASVYYALGKRPPRRYLFDRVLRLLVPLLAGMLTYVPLLVYLERVQHGEFQGSFLDFLRGPYFDGLYGIGGNFAWMGLHLWYLEFLFIFTLLLLPLLAWLRRAPSGQRALNRFGRLLARPGMIYLMALPLVGLIAVLNPEMPWGFRQLGGWTLWEYLLVFFYGFLLVAGAEHQAAIGRQRWVSLGLALAALFARVALQSLWPEPAFGTVQFFVTAALLSVFAWGILLAVWGFSMAHLNFGTRTLWLANEAVLPFYIMHQTFIVILGYFIVRWAVPDLLKYSLITGGTLLLMFALHFALIRRSNVLRALFGLLPRPAEEKQPSQSPALESVGGHYPRRFDRSDR